MFAHIAAPQIRLTKDPNTYFFFLDHLDKAPPFRIEDATTGDTNLELGIYWGLRLIERDEEIHGKNSNAKMFVLVSDGEVWSGEAAKSIKLAVERGVPINVVGVGTLAGGALPVFKDEKGEVVVDPEAPTTSPRSRRAAADCVCGRGQYFELDRDGDRHIANQIVDAGKKMAPSLGAIQESESFTGGSSRSHPPSRSSVRYFCATAPSSGCKWSASPLPYRRFHHPRLGCQMGVRHPSDLIFSS